jgi:hypothetical protein
MSIATPLDEFRLLLGDRDSATPIYNDVEAQWFIDQQASVPLAVADALEALAREYARKADVTIDGQSFKLSQASKAYADRAKELRATAGAAVTTQYVTRQDAYSDTISAEDTRAHPSAADVNRSSDWDPCGYDLDPDHDIPA